MVRIIPNRLKSHNGKVGSQPPSRSSSPMRTPSSDQKGLVLRTTVVKGRNLAAKDKSGTSDPFLVVNLGESGQSTPTITKTLNPEWNVSFDLPITGPKDLLLEATCWDKDRFSNDYMGEFDVAVEDVFGNGKVTQQPRWYPLKSHGKTKKKKSEISGEVQIQFTLADTSDPSASPQDLLQKLSAITTVEGDDDSVDDDEALAQIDSLDLEDDDDDDDNDADGKETGTSDETDNLTKEEKVEKKKRKLRMKRLRRKTKARAYEFTGGTDVVGIVFLEVHKITDLPPERNVTRTSFDMDPFVVTSLGRKTYRTRVISHNLNPVFEEKMVFQVMRHEQNYSMSFVVVDRDKLSGNDFVGTVNLPLSNLTTNAPEADPDTGLYSLPDPSDPTATAMPQKPSRFRLPLSRSASATSLNKAARPHLTSQSSQSSMRGGMSSGGQPELPTAPTSAPLDGNFLAPTASNPSTSGEVVIEDAQQNPDDPLIKTYTLPLALKNKDRWEDKHYPQLIVKAKYQPYQALRQQFWRAMLKQYDADDNARVSKVELTTMLDTLGSTLKESTIDGFFKRFSSGVETSEPLMTYDQTVMCLEDQLQKSMTHKSWSDRIKNHANHASSRMAGMHGQKDQGDTGAPLAATDGQNLKPIASETMVQDVPAIAQDRTGAAGEEGDFMNDDLTDERGEEHVVEIRECPLCHQPRLNKKSDADIITHIATCANSDWRSVNNLVMAGFVTSNQARRKWYSKVLTKISYGGYKLGANSANTLVQDRITGQINEERMSVYVRIGIRLLYKGFKSREMEKKRAQKLLRNMSLKQGRKFDDPASARQIQDFINFHQLDMSEVLKPTDQFKNFNEFFYRQLKPTARPCSAPNNPKIIVSPADCRSVVFNTIDEAQKIWVKGTGFSMATLLGNAYPEDVKRFAGGSMGICRLAPQDYHRFHIPVDGIMGEPKLIKGQYYTVNPMAIRSNLDVYGENVRVCVPIDSVAHGRVMVICVGAMMVGSTVITRKAGEKVRRAEELGYFKFGGSTILLLFEPGAMQYDDDIVDNSNGAVETLLRVGMSIGHSPEQSQYAPDMRKQEENITEEERDEAKRRIEGSLNTPDRYTGPEVAM